MKRPATSCVDWPVRRRISSTLAKSTAGATTAKWKRAEPLSSMEVTRPTGMPLGKSVPTPEVTIRSPGVTSAPSRAMNLKRRPPLGSPSTSPAVRVRCTTAPTVEVGSLRSWTTEAPVRTCATRPTSPSGTMAGIWSAMPSLRPRLTVSERAQPPPSRPTILLVDLACLQGLDAHALVVGAQRSVLRANRPPVGEHVPGAEGAPLNLGERALERIEGEGEEVTRTRLPAPARLHGEEQQ